MSGYTKCPCDGYEPGTDGICVDPECGHDGHQHNAAVGDHEACLAQEGDEPGCYLPFEQAEYACPDPWQPYHDAGSRPEHCATCSESSPRPGDA